MTETTVAPNELLRSRHAQMFPKLTAAQLARLETHGARLQARLGDILVEAGERPRKFLVVLTGRLELLMSRHERHELIYALSAGDFTGEMSMLRGSAGIVRIRAGTDCTLLAIDVEQLRSIVQTDTELSELFMRAFILRRMGLLSEDSCDVVLIGSTHSADALRLREFLTRNTLPFKSLDLETDADARALLERFHIEPQELPVVICRGQRVLKNPTNFEVANCLGVNPTVDANTIYDLLIVGAGPAGLAAAVYGASEGLSVRLVETMAAGGQAGSSSRIENYLGFPTGISGHALAGRALSQAQKFGANLTVALCAVRLHTDRRPFLVDLDDGSSAVAHVILIASGARYRTPTIENLQRYLGAGIYYAATALEANLCKAEDIIVVGGGNSAGQAAVYLAGTCRQVHILVRADGLAESMSQYLINRIKSSPNITLHVRTQVTALDGEHELQSITWRCADEPAPEQHAIGHVFMMTGASPNTSWLNGSIALDDKGFIKTGLDLSAPELGTAGWPLTRQPFLLETSHSGVFAAGDVRSGSVKRVATAVGEGSSCVQFVHRALAEACGGLC
ncbi:MAG TPA: FAD-dependent oxidoreductase [Steroidobacteraceae bacterium]